MRDLLDVNVWLALSAPDHIHHDRSLRYWYEEMGDEAAFCRVTALALLRLLTNAAVLGESALGSSDAWDALRRWMSTPGVTYANEPDGVDQLLATWAGEFNLKGGDWTDVYLAAFAGAGDLRLVTFDSGFARFPGIRLLDLSRA